QKTELNVDAPSNFRDVLKRDYHFPLPPSGTDCGWIGTEAITLNCPIRGPIVAGLKTMRIVHCAPGASVLPQSSLCEKAIPEVRMLAISTADGPRFASVTGWASPAVPTS